jgi:hypothetical protein
MPHSRYRAARREVADMTLGIVELDLLDERVFLRARAKAVRP